MQRCDPTTGMTTDHGMWPGASAAKGGIGNGGKPDTKNTACMKNCKTEVQVGSVLPDYARNAHGNLADQSRSFGPVRGVKTGESVAVVAAVPGVGRRKGHDDHLHLCVDVGRTTGNAGAGTDPQASPR